MKNIKGWYLPNWDTHFENLLQQKNNRWEYQQPQRDYALSFVKEFKTNAIDAGSNVGFWSKEMCEKFNQVYAFEPHPDNLECYKENLKEFKNYTLYGNAISNVTDKELTLYVSPDECGNASLNNFGVQEGNTNRKIDFKQLKTIKVLVKKIDDYNFNNIGFIKVDCQNHEKEVVEGAIQTIQRCKPVLCLELPIRNDKEKEYRNNLTEYLKKYNYVCKGNLKKETIFVYE
jgi:FkbM family methyltransferase